MALKTLMVKIGADTTGLQKGLKDSKRGISGLSKGISGATKGVASLAKGALALAGVAGLVSTLKKASQAGVGLESSMRRVNDIFGEAQKHIFNFGQTTARTLGMGEASAYQYASTFGNLFAGITRDQEENAKVTINMLRAAAVVSSKTGRTIEDVNERIRSGLLGSTEAIEDLGIYTNVSMMEMSDAFKKIASGRSWAQLNFHEQQQVRILSILEQAHARFGDEVSGGTAFAVGSLTENFKDLLAWTGRLINSGLAPIFQWLNKIVMAATDAVRALAGLFGVDMSKQAAEITDSAQGQAGAYDDLTDAIKDTEKAQQRLAGFDEINTLTSGKAGASGTGGVGSSPFDSLVLPDIDESKFNFKGKVELSSNAQAILDSLKAMFKSIKDFIKQIGDDWKLVWNTDGRGEQIIDNIASTLKNIIDTITAISEAFKKAWNSDFGDLTLGQKILTNIQNTIQNITGFVKRVTEAIKEWWQGESGQEFALGLLTIFENITNSVERVTNAINKIWDNGGKEVFTLLMDIGGEIIEIFGNVISGFFDFFATVFEKKAGKAEDTQLQGIRDFLNVIKKGLEWLNGDGKPILEKIGGVLGELLVVLLAFKAATAIVGIVSAVAGLVNPVTLVIIGIVAAYEAVKIWIQYFNDLKDSASLFFKIFKKDSEETTRKTISDFDESGTAGKSNSEIIAHSWAALFYGMEDGVKAAYDWIREVFQNLSSWFIEKVLDPIKNGFTAAFDWVNATADKLWSGITDGAKGLVNSIIGVINGLVRGVYAGINAVIRMLNKIQINIPDWVPGELGGKTFGFSLQEAQPPQIPMLADGGIAYDYTLAGVAEYAGSQSNPEVIAPLDRLVGILKKAIGDSGGGSVTVPVTVVLDDGTIVGRTTSTIRRNSRRGLAEVT